MNLSKSAGQVREAVMTVGVALVCFRLHEIHSLKDKRRIVKSLVEKSRSRFNVAVAEVCGPGRSSEGIHWHCRNRQRWARVEFAAGPHNRFHGFAQPGRYGQPGNRVDTHVGKVNQ